MIILTIVSFFTSLFNIGGIGDWFMEIIYKMLLFFDGLAYNLLAYSFKLFQLMCTLNFNSLYGLISGLLTRIEALVMVFVVYKLGISLINFMLNPDEASKKGKEILINIFITAALLLSYNTIFTLFNEISMLIIGTPENYNYVVLGQVADITGSKDIGLINRLVFGTNEEMPDVGEFIAFSTASTFITDATDPMNTEPLKKELATSDGHLDFSKLPNIAGQIDKKYDYFEIVGFLGAIYMIYSFVKATIQIGVRAFKLLILQVLAPVAIITIIGEGTKGKTFKNFVNKYISVYIELFVRMFSMLLICSFVVKFIKNIGDYFPGINSDEWYTVALMILLILVAAFKFAGDIPKFIDEILSTHLSDGKGKGGFGHFVGGLLGAGIGLAAGLSTGTLAGAVTGFFGGASAGAKGKNVADFFKGQATNATNTRNVGANARLAGGSLSYAGSRVSGFLGRPQRKLEKGKLASERQTALDNMIKAVEDGYDGKVTIGGQEVGLSRDIFRNYAYDDSDNSPFGFYGELSGDTRQVVDKTNAAYKAYTSAQQTYENKRAVGAATAADFQAVEDARMAYQSIKSKADKMIDTDYNTKMLKEIKDNPKLVKEKSRNAVKRSIETYDHVASDGYTTDDFINDPNGKKNTKSASDHYTIQQDKTTHSRTATNWTNSNSRGGSGH